MTFITWYHMEASNTRSQLPDPQIVQAREAGLLLQQTYKGRSWKVFLHSSPRCLGVHFFLLGSKIPHESCIGSTGFIFCGWLWYPCYGLSSGPASLAQSSGSCDRFCDEDHFFSEKMLFGHRHSQKEGTEVSESFLSKRWAKASVMP